ncbi:MAG: ABC transporter substrate-binding protein, partial [Xanthomonadales bacterium]|nr:ABC transporter substrate-binding protein [Xanthomonadales bacterium]
MSGTTRRAFLRRSSLALMGLAGAAMPIVRAAESSRILHLRSYTDVTSFDPPHTVSGAEGIIMEAMFQSLLQIKAGDTWGVTLDAAEYFEKLDDTHYAFRLKRGQMYSNGFGEMTAGDVKFSLERVVDPALNALNAPDMGTLSHVEVHDRYSGVLVLESPYAAFETV